MLAEVDSVRADPGDCQPMEPMTYDSDQHWEALSSSILRQADLQTKNVPIEGKVSIVLELCREQFFLTASRKGLMPAYRELIEQLPLTAEVVRPKISGIDDRVVAVMNRVVQQKLEQLAEHHELRTMKARKANDGGSPAKALLDSYIGRPHH